MKITQSLRNYSVLFAFLAGITGLWLSTPAVRGDTFDIVASGNAFGLRSAADTVQTFTTNLTTKRLNDSNARVVYLRFDLTSWYQTHTPGSALSATLRLYSELAVSETVRVWALNDTIGGTNGFDAVWSGSTLTWNNQPAKTASPNDIPSASGALPNANTSKELGTQAFSTIGEVDIVLTNIDFNNYMLTNDSNHQITLMFDTILSDNPTWAAISDTGGLLKPTLTITAPASGGGPVIPINWSASINSDWDATTTNWLNAGSPTNYADNNALTFDDTAASSAVNLTSAFFPASVLVSNSVLNYTFTGSGSIGGSASLTKVGTGSLLLDNSGNSSFNGGTLIAGGTVQVGNGDANGSIGTGGITNNGVLIFNRTTTNVAANTISGTGSVQKLGSGTLTLSAVNTYGGATRVDSGTLVVNNSLAGGGLLTNAPGSIVVLKGANYGSVDIGGTLQPGGINSAGTFTAGNGLTVESTGKLIFDLSTSNAVGGANDLIVVTNNLTANNSAIAVNPSGLPLFGVPYRLINFSGSRVGTFNSTITGTHLTTTLDQSTPNQVNLTFSGTGAKLRWNSLSDPTWDTANTPNWFNFGTANPADIFGQGDSVLLDDTSGVQTSITLNLSVAPSAVTNNSSANNFTIAGSGKITGTAGIVKNGTSTLTLSNANDFTGPVTILAGVLRTGNNTALGATNAGTTVSSGAALDLFGHNIGAESLTVSGSGPDAGAANGALYNNGAAVSGNQAVQRLTLTGDTYIGGSGRWDLRSTTTGDATGASLSTGSQPYKLVKVGANTISLANLTIDPALGDIDVQAGILELNGSITTFGNTASNLFVRNSATLQLSQVTNLLNKKFSLDDGAIINNASGTNTIVGPMVLNGADTLAVPVGMLVLSNALSGTGSLNKNSTNTLVLAGTDTHSGGIVLNDGTLVLNTTNNNTGDLFTENPVSGLTMRVIAGGNGTFKGAMDIEDTLWPGVNGRPSTLNIGNGVDYINPGTGDDFFGALAFGGFLTANQTAIFSLNTATTAGSGVNDLVNVTGDISANSTKVYINPLTPLATGSTYTLINYSGVLNNGTFNTASLLPWLVPTRYRFTLNQGSHVISLTVNVGAGTLRWNNNAGTGIWDLTNSFNWFNTGGATNDYFAELDNVLFDDTVANLPANTTVSLGASTNGLVPAALTVSSDNNNYTLTGNGRIIGATGLTKTGTSLLTLDTTNSFTGNILIKGGTVRINNTNALGSWLSGSVTVTNGATLDIGGWAGSSGNNNNMFGPKQFFIAGAGVTNGGVLVNNGTTNQNAAFELVTLTADATIGGTARFDLRNGAPNPVLDLAGHTLTKAGNNQVSVVNGVITNGGSIVINSGTMSFETVSLVTNGTIVINANGALGHFRTSAGAITRAITLNGGVITNLSTSGGGSTNDANITLTANSIVSHPAGSDLILNGVIAESGGSFGITKGGVGRTVLTANESYTGSTVISAGTLALVGSGSIAASSNITVQAGATFEVANGANGTFTVTAGRTLNGSGTVAGSLSNATGGLVAPGTPGVTGILTVTSNANLNGTVFLKLNASANTNDVVSAGGNLVLGGTLSVSNIAGSLAGGQSYKLFNAAAYTTNYTTLVPSTPGPNLAWDTTALTNGILKVVSVGPPPTPRITTISLSGTTLSISATNGSAGSTWTLLQSTNVALPLAQWLTNRTGTFNVNGTMSTNIASVVTNGGEFYILKY